MTRFLLKLIFTITLLSVLVIGAGKVLGQFREGNTLLYIRLYQDYQQIYLLDTTAHIEYPLTHSPMGNLSAIWSPDGESIAYFNIDGLYVMDAYGRNRRLLLEDARSCLVTGCWSPDGRLLIVRGFEVDANGARIVNATTGEVQRFNEGEEVRDPMRWSPNDLYVIQFSYDSTVTTVQLSVVNVETRETLLTTNTLPPTSYMSWSSDGRYIVYVQVDDGDREVYVGDVDSRTIWNVSQMPDQDDFSPVWSPDGTHIAFRSGDSIAIVDVNGNNRRFLHPSAPIEDLYVWVDSRLLILNHVDSTAQHLPLMWMDVDSGEISLIADDVFDHSAPLLSPDSRLLIYFNQRESLVRVVTADGDRLWSFPYEDGATAGSSMWSPDSREVSFSVFSFGVTLYVLNIDDGEYFTIDNARFAQWQPTP